jgi:hypothetical protein
MSARRQPTILSWRLAPEPTHDGNLVAGLWRVPESVAFQHDHEVVMWAIEQKPMRHAGRNADNVSGREFVPIAALLPWRFSCGATVSPLSTVPPTMRVAEPDCTKNTSL